MATGTGSNEPVPGERRITQYDPRIQDRSVISVPLLRRLAANDDPETPIPVIVDVNLDYPGGRSHAAVRARELIAEAITNKGIGTVVQGEPSHKEGGPFVVAELQPAVIRELARLDLHAAPASERAVFQIWPDFHAHALLDRSVATVKADAAHASFAAFGKGICWAVLDTGIDSSHRHFDKFKNLQVAPLEHRDFTGTGAATKDADGHGTHVAGIIGGYAGTPEDPVRTARYMRDEQGDIKQNFQALDSISGIAPQCKLVSYKVLNDQGTGPTSDILAALDAIQKINDYGRRLVIHGVNLSLGYDFDPEWFACGQSPLCVEVDRMVRSGVVVVVAAGNSGYAYGTDVLAGRAIAAGRMLTVNDPGNADLAITVGSTHRDMPHVYGVSYFSSKGPTGDGRAKPDVVAPGERILSAATGNMRKEAAGDSRHHIEYVESSGTSMAAPHVSGVIAAFLSIRREYIGRPDVVKNIFTSTATDLGRVPNFQGHGLVDVMRAIQSV